MTITINTSFEQPHVDYAWALIRNGIVTSVIVADIEFVNTLSDTKEYDFIIDVVLMEPRPSPGWLYNSQQNAFSSPPVDPDQVLAQDLPSLYDLLHSVLVDSQGSNISNVINQFINDRELQSSETDLWNSIKTWLLAGG